MSEPSSSPRISVTESLFVKASPEALWDWTQDWSRRREWDRSILAVEVVNAGAAGAAPRVRIRAAGGVTAVIHYKEFLRPRQTSVVMEEVQSWLLEGGGGAWSYVPRDGGTE